MRFPIQRFFLLSVIMTLVNGLAVSAHAQSNDSGTSDGPQWTYYEETGLGILSAADAEGGYFCTSPNWSVAESGFPDAANWSIHFVAESPNLLLKQFRGMGCDFISLPVVAGDKGKALRAEAEGLGLTELTTMMQDYAGAESAPPVPQAAKIELMQNAASQCSVNAIRSLVFDCTCVGETVGKNVDAGKIKMLADNQTTISRYRDEVYTAECLNEPAIKNYAKESCLELQFSINPENLSDCLCEAEKAFEELRTDFSIDTLDVGKIVTYDILTSCNG
ncbi:hypothetical protein [Roseovarius sp. EL26]|uniref:hypothetical protein n=1 Tax=Roseovarius sp. EL26 TaxID=2126672 RepID=UPI0013C4EC70|nr:hypothetical protein [Roseovarius sp. EL26]